MDGLFKAFAIISCTAFGLGLVGFAIYAVNIMEYDFDGAIAIVAIIIVILIYKFLTRDKNLDGK